MNEASKLNEFLGTTLSALLFSVDDLARNPVTVAAVEEFSDRGVDFVTEARLTGQLSHDELDNMVRAGAVALQVLVAMRRAQNFAAGVDDV